MAKRSRRKTYQSWIGLVILVGFLLIVGIFFRGSISRALSVVQSPFVQAGTWINAMTGGLFEPERMSREEREELLSSRSALAVDYARLAQLEEENTQLREQLSFIERRALNIASAHIIGRSASKQSSSIVIDIGERDGVVIGSPVFVGSGIFVGKVTQLTAGTSTVTGVSDLSMATAASFLNETRTLGIAEGAIGNLVNLRFIPHEELVSVNELVITSGLEGFIPSGLLIGVVTSVTNNPNAPFQEAIVEPLVDLDRYHTVSVILPEV